jgi:hypothetical protein
LLAVVVMRSFGLTRILFGVLVISGLLAAVASAEDCAIDCGLTRRGCLREARTALSGCTAQCREAGDAAPDCMRGCVASFVGAKDTCRDAVRGCLDKCPPKAVPDAPSACRLGCGQTLTGCVRDVQVGARHCVRGCADAGDHSTCVAACTAQSQAGAATCRTGLQTCLGGCKTPAVRQTRLGS